uniref:Uncharacterized protein n=1 Tax=Arundo donax TaxID=35708 RepID=A0A0A8Z9I6_ARUDO
MQGRPPKKLQMPADQSIAQGFATPHEQAWREAHWLELEAHDHPAAMVMGAEHLEVHQ